MSTTRPAWAPRALEQILGRLRPEEAEARRRWLAQFEAAGLPDRRHERWKYTDLAPLAETDYRLATLPDAAPSFERPALPDALRVVFVNGLYAAHLSQHEALDALRLGAPDDHAGDDAIALLNAALATGGCELQLPAGRVLELPLHLYCWQSHDETAMAHLRHRIVLGERSEATVLLDQQAEGGLSTITLDVELGRGARLNLYRLQRHGDGARCLTRTGLRLAAGASARVVGVDVGGERVRNDLCVTLAGEAADLWIAGAAAIQGHTHLDNHVSVEHAEPGGRSRQLFRGVIGEQAHGVLNSRVVVKPGAQRSDSEQSLRHLLLDTGAEINAKPELEIYADDVSCAHGATVGQLDIDAVHYLRTRGIDEATARALMLRAFLADAISSIDDEAIRRLAESALSARLPTIPELGELG